MGWLAWAQRNFKTYPWEKAGCSLVEMTDDQLALALREYMDGFKGDNYLATLQTPIPAYGLEVEVRGMNPHGEGRLHNDRGGVILDVPFFAVKWLVFDRDRARCQDCGCYGWESHRVYEGRKLFAPAKVVYDKPIMQEDVDREKAELYHDGTPIGYFRYATPTDARGLQVHHIVAVVDGGSNCTHNLMLLCWKCHLARKGRGGVPTVLDGIQARLA